MPGFFGRQDFNDFAVFDLVFNGYNAAVDLCANHAVAHRAMNGIGKVDNRRTKRQADDLALWRKDKDLLRHQIGLDVPDNIGGVFAILLVFQHLTNPCQAVFKRIAFCQAQLILPVRCDTVFCGVVHLPSANLHLKGNALFTEYRRMQ